MRQSCCAMLMFAWQWINLAILPRPKTRRAQLLAFVCGLTMAGIVPVAPAQIPSSTPPRRGRKIKTEASRAVTPAQPPLVTALPAGPALTPEETPPSAPQVTWDGSQLTIITNNSTLADILAAVRAHTGAEIDIPESASRERMAAKLGPGPVRDVLSTLLSWTGFNYVVQASDKNPGGIQSILLIPRPKDATEVAANTATAAPRGGGYRQAFEPNPPAETQDPPDSPLSTQSPAAVELAPSTEVTAQSATPTASADVSPTVAELQTSPTNSQTGATTPETNRDSNQPKVPAQMIEQLQSMYQQRLQLQESQKPRTEQTP